MVRMDRILFICSSIEGHLGGFQLGAILNKAAINNCVHISVGTQVFIVFRDKCLGLPLLCH